MLSPVPRKAQTSALVVAFHFAGHTFAWNKSLAHAFLIAPSFLEPFRKFENEEVEKNMKEAISEAGTA